jgi:membrane protease YdiL (CAAX protease family)
MSRNGYRSMIVVALTADVCEEFLFRGFVTWYFLEFWPGSRIGLVLAVISAIPFGFAHIYFGVWQVWMSAVVGVFFAAVVLAAGSLLPAMIMHAVMDLNSFDLGHRALRKTDEAGDNPAISGLS